MIEAACISGVSESPRIRKTTCLVQGRSAKRKRSFPSMVIPTESNGSFRSVTMCPREYRCKDRSIASAIADSLEGLIPIASISPALLTPIPNDKIPASASSCKIENASSRRLAEMALESDKIGMIRCQSREFGSTDTAADTSGHAQHHRPASSTPTTIF